MSEATRLADWLDAEANKLDIAAQPMTEEVLSELVKYNRAAHLLRQFAAAEAERDRMGAALTLIKDKCHNWTTAAIVETARAALTTPPQET